ncbi:MAG: hypothetical protein IKE23_06475 [Exiguobacterium sp.]|nr:hypothetical protein [Exiguobacterium sp.]
MATKKKGESIAVRWNDDPSQIKSSPNRKVTDAEKKRAQKELEAFLRAKKG